MSEKKCFVITPIGKDDSEIRDHSDKLLKHIIQPIVEKLGYNEPMRADKILTPGIITMQIVEHLVNDDLVIADLTGGNPNVFYELAIRHITKKPIVQLIKKGDHIPFDVTVIRTIEFDLKDLDNVEQCKKMLEDQIREAEKNPTMISSLIPATLDLIEPYKASKPLEKKMEDMIGILLKILPIQLDIHKDMRAVLDGYRSGGQPLLGLLGAYDLDQIRKNMLAKALAEGGQWCAQKSSQMQTDVSGGTPPGNEPKK
jgi:hypothetical protein